MEVILAEHAGFCFGVRRAVEQVYEQAETGRKLYTYGPIVHNEEVVRDLERRGVQVIDTPEQLAQIEEGVVMIRAHGVPRSIIEMTDREGITCVDATCPFVKRIHNIVSRESAAGRRIVIIGNAGHPEVEGIVGWTEGKATVLGTPEEAREFTCQDGEELCIVSQTTFNYNKFQDMVEIIMEKGYNVSVVNTICNATQERQTEAGEIASRVDVMIVIGGKHSSNTRKLYEICMQECANTYFIQTLDDLHLALPKSVRRVGITAGASTPNNIIEEVQNYVRINF